MATISWEEHLRAGRQRFTLADALNYLYLHDSPPPLARGGASEDYLWADAVANAATLKDLYEIIRSDAAGPRAHLIAFRYLIKAVANLCEDANPFEDRSDELKELETHILNP